MKSEQKFIIGIFDDEEHMIHAAKDVRKSNISIYDFYTPFPVHGIDDLLDIKRSRLPVVTFIFGGLGLVAALYFQYWTSKVSWPIIVGGKPYNSFAAFIPVAFEITVLFGALSTVLAFFFRSKLFPGRPITNFYKEQTDDKFLMVIEEVDATLDQGLLKEIMEKNHALEVIHTGNTL